jgi:hypothetical protein
MNTRKPTQGLTVVPLPPAKPKPRSLADFDKWLALGIKLETIYERFGELDLEVEEDTPYTATDKHGRTIPLGSPRGSARRLLREWPRDKLAAKVAKFVEGWEFYDRNELYEKDDDGVLQLRHHVICEQVATLLGTFPNAAPHSPEVYTPRLIEEIVAANPGAIQLEAACRWLLRNCTFLPTVAEMLKAIRGAKVPCWDAFGQDDDGEANIIFMHKELEKTLAALPDEDASA